MQIQHCSVWILDPGLFECPFRNILYPWWGQSAYQCRSLNHWPHMSNLQTLRSSVSRCPLWLLVDPMWPVPLVLLKKNRKKKKNIGIVTSKSDIFEPSCFSIVLFPGHQQAWILDFEENISPAPTTHGGPRLHRFCCSSPRNKSKEASNCIRSPSTSMAFLSIWTHLILIHLTKLS